jgi:hypothetical protein
MTRDTSRASLITVFVTLMICLTIMACSMLLTEQIARFTNRGDIIAVKGYAEKHVESDWAEWNMTLSVTGETRAEAVEKGGSLENLVLDYLKKSGVKPDQIQLRPMELHSVQKRDSQGNETNIVDYYIGTVEVLVSTPDTRLVEKISREAVRLNGPGVSIASDAPRYLIRDIEQYKLELLHNATRSAEARAKEIVLASGRKLGSLRAANQGVFQVTALNSVDVSGYGEYDTSTRQKKISLVMTTEYGVGK